MSELCATHDEFTLHSTQQAYSQAIDAWGAVEIFKFGPVIKENRFNRIFYWPDRKGRGRRQIIQLLRKHDTNTLSSKSLANKSIATQGLTALEILLFDQEALQGIFSCK